MPSYTVACQVPSCGEVDQVYAPMSEASDLSTTRFFCKSCHQPTMMRVYSMNLVGLDKFRGIEGQTTNETRKHWIERGKAAGLDPVPADQHSWT